MMTESLKKTARGTVLAFAGLVIFLLLEFIIRVIIARTYGEMDYGIFNIGYVIFTFFVMIAGLGLYAGAPRYIAYYLGTGESRKAAGVVSSSLWLSLLGGIVFGLLFFLLSDIFAVLFHLESPIVFQIFSIAIPFSVLIEILAAIFMGFSSVKEKVYYRDILSSLLRVIAILIVIRLGYGFISLLSAYVLAIIIAALLFTLASVKMLSRMMEGGVEPMGREIILFSLPLWTTNILNTVIFTMDTLILGYFTTAVVVGLYNAARPITQFLNVFIVALSFMYIPVASQLYAKNHIEEIRRNYIVLTKWIYLAAFPFFLVSFLFPWAVVTLLFGPAYAQPEVTLTLQILALGVLINIISGPNAPTLIVIGKPRLVLLDNFLAAVVYLCLNVTLIPSLGMIGAAVASTVSFGVVNLVKSLQIYRFHQIHPFSQDYIKTVICSLLLFVLAFVVMKILQMSTVTLWMVIPVTLLLLGVYAALLYVTGSLEPGEITNIIQIFRRSI